jgi:hypothetical protein
MWLELLAMGQPPMTTCNKSVAFSSSLLIVYHVKGMWHSPNMMHL